MIGFSAPAMAQDAAPAPGGAGEVEAIVVTGTRMLNGNASPVPQTVVSTEQLLTAQPGPVAQALSALPAFAGAASAGSGTNTAGTSLSLRFLGYSRTLVLFDGKRLAPTTYDQYVDANTVPQELLSRVDVVTGGVSAVYGSDAVAGVVNFITDRNFNGFKGHAQYGISDYGDAATQDIGLALGAPLFDGRGHIEGSVQYQNDEGLSRRSKREWGVINTGQFGLGTADSPFHNIEYTRVSSHTFGGRISGATGAGKGLNGLTFDSPGVLGPFVDGVESGSPDIQSGGGGAFNDASARPSQKIRQLFGRFDYDLTSDIHFFVEGAYDKSNYKAYDYDQRFNKMVFSGTNAFLPSQYQFDGTFKLSKYDTQLPRDTVEAVEKAYFFIAGLEGSLGEFKWDVAINQAKSKIHNNIPSQIDLEKLYAATDAVTDSSGNIACRASITNPELYSGCVPYNMFGPNAASQAAMDYVLSPTYYESTNGMTDLTANIAGRRPTTGPARCRSPCRPSGARTASRSRGTPTRPTT